MGRIQVYHFHNGAGGGVLAVIRNLLRYSDDSRVENHVIYTINRDQFPDYRVQPLAGASSQEVFYYSPRNNFFHTCRQLAQLLPGGNPVIVAHDWLELGMVSHLGLQNPVVQVLHGNYDYYYELAKKHEQSVDEFIAVSPAISNKLVELIPGRSSNIHYCPFPVSDVPAAFKPNRELRLFYCVRDLLEDNKQFKQLPLINRKLQANGIKVEWTIIGEGINQQEIENLMNQESGIALHASLSNEQVAGLLPGHDIVLLPSLQEGFPVVVVEAMKAGLVPLVTNWGGATEELIIDNVTGYYINISDTDSYCEKIQMLHTNRDRLRTMSQAAITAANGLFDPRINTQKIESVILQAEQSPKQKGSFKVYGSRLDEAWVPNWIVKATREWRGSRGMAK